MNAIALVVGIIGALPAVAWLLSRAYRYLTGRLTWDEVYRLVDREINRLRTDNPKFQPDTIVAIGRGGTLLASFIAVYFDVQKIYSVQLGEHYGDRFRALESSGLRSIKSSQILIVAGASYTGFALATVKDVLGDRAEPIQLLSYVFWYHPSSTDDESDSVLATPDYVSNRHNRFVPPWYKKAGGPIIESDRPRLEFSGPGARVTQISIDTSDVSPVLTMESEALLHALSRAIKSCSTTSDHYTIVIAGPAGIGKSRLATRLMDELSNATHLPLDASIKESAFRDGAQINGCQLQAYDLPMIKDWAEKLAAEQEFIISPLDHALRKPHGSQTVDGKSKFRLIEWIFAGSPQAIPGDLGIVIDANDDARFHFWFDRYERVRGMQVTSEVRRLINERLNSTAEEIAPHLENWDIRFNIGADRTVLRIDSKCREFSEEVLGMLATAPIKSTANFK